MITSVNPTTWRELQNEVARILLECGFSVETERTVDMPRGTSELDVVAEETVRGRRYCIVCECKRWQRPVPKSVVHAFRTVVTETGANVGYIVSSRGFQSGARAAAQSTNIQLVTWEEFQAAFEQTWFKDYFCPEVSQKLDPLFTYVEPLLPPWFDKLSEDDQDKYLDLNRQHAEFGFLMLSYALSSRRMVSVDLLNLPLSGQVREDSGIPTELLTLSTYREFLEAATLHGQSAIAQFRKLRDSARGDP